MFRCFGCGKIEGNEQDVFQDGWCQDCIVSVFKYLIMTDRDMIYKALEWWGIQKADFTLSSASEYSFEPKQGFNKIGGFTWFPAASYSFEPNQEN
jgi:hypothetical protein